MEEIRTEERIEELRQMTEAGQEIDFVTELERNDLHGRRPIYCSLQKHELTPENIIKKMPEILAIHKKNSEEITYLDNYYKGIQPILYKTKKIRPEINNKVVVNHAYEIVEFKKTYVFGDPVQYVMKGEKNNNEINPQISLLNKQMESEDKASKDKELAEWLYKIGTAYRWTDTDSGEDEDEAPFEIAIPDPRRTFVVYSTGIKKEQLFSGYIEYFSEQITTDEATEIREYAEYIIYLYDKMMVLTDKNGILQLKDLGKDEKGNQVPNPYALIIPGHRIIEYPLNASRMGLIELVMSQLNALNRITSNEIDDIEQFVQSLLVYINQEIDLERHKEVVEAGAVEISSSDPAKPADLKLLSQKMQNSEVKQLKDDTYNDALTIAGIPRLNDKPSGGDTGQARLLGEGWTMADERAKQDELSFIKSERQFLKLVLKICKGTSKEETEGLSTLKLSNIDIKFTRNKSDNILVKTQALMNLMSAQCPPDIAFTVVQLFSDPNAVFEKAKEYYGEELWKKEVSKISNSNEFEVMENQKKENQDTKQNILTHRSKNNEAHNTTNKSEKTRSVKKEK